MKNTLKHFPENKRCPVCGTNDDAECALIPIIGTQEGSNCQAQPIHVGCILENISYDPVVGVLFATAKKGSK